MTRPLPSDAFYVGVLESDVSLIDDTISDLLDQCSAAGCDLGEVMFRLRIALFEALANAVIHGNREEREKRVYIHAYLADGAVEVHVRDEGGGFDPSTLPDPTLPENRLKESGRGVCMMRDLLDEVAYNDRGNEVWCRICTPTGSAVPG